MLVIGLSNNRLVIAIRKLHSCNKTTYLFGKFHLSFLSGTVKQFLTLALYEKNKCK